MEKEYKISWLKVILIIILIFILIGVFYLVFLKKDNKNEVLISDNYIENMSLMKEAGFEYFQGDNLPDEIGKSKEITLGEMIDSKLIMDFKDENGKSCNLSESYIKVTKTLDNEYAMKVNLVCDSKADYIVTTIANNIACVDCGINKDTTDNTSSDSNKEVVNNYYYNTYNGSSNNSSSKNNSSNSDSSKGTSIVNYNITYTNGCNCNGNNCGNCKSNVYYSVYFETNGGSYVPKQVVKYGDTANYVTSYRDGYQFMGWYLDKDLTIEYNFSAPVTNTITLYAKWKKLSSTEKRKFRVSYDSNGGSSVPSEEVNEGNAATRPKDPTRKCYRFVGWYLNGIKYDFSRPVREDIVLEAKWEDDGSCREETIYTVVFDSNGGSRVNNQYVSEGNRASRPNNPVRDGYTFLGWYYNNSEFNFNTSIYHDYTLVARWEKDEVKYNTYCEIKDETYYSVSYVGDNKKTTNMAWTIKFDNIRNTNNLRIVDVGYITSTTQYNNAYSKNTTNKGISQVGGDAKYNVPVSSGYMLEKYSLKSSNFTMGLSVPYYSGSYWYTNASVNISNYNNVTSYYAPNINSSIYLVPFYFKVRYTDRSNCINDLASKSSKYSNYEIVDTFYR